MKVLSKQEAKYVYYFKIELNDDIYVGYVPKELFKLCEMIVFAGQAWEVNLENYRKVLMFYFEYFKVIIRDDELWLPDISFAQLEVDKIRKEVHNDREGI